MIVRLYYHFHFSECINITSKFPFRIMLLALLHRDRSQENSCPNFLIVFNMQGEHYLLSVEEEHETICWGCGIRLLVSPYAPVFKCGWCGAITNKNSVKCENKYYRWRRLRDRFFVGVLSLFMLFIICKLLVLEIILCLCCILYFEIIIFLIYCSSTSYLNSYMLGHSIFLKLKKILTDTFQVE